MFLGGTSTVNIAHDAGGGGLRRRRQLRLQSAAIGKQLGRRDGPLAVEAAAAAAVGVSGRVERRGRRRVRHAVVDGCLGLGGGVGLVLGGNSIDKFSP